MRNKTPRYYNYIASLLVVTTLSMSGSALFWPKEVHAENTIASGFGSALLGCANANGAITDGLTSLFDGITSSFNFSIEGTDSPTPSSATDVTGSEHLETYYDQAADNDNPYEDYDAVSTTKDGKIYSGSTNSESGLSENAVNGISAGVTALTDAIPQGPQQVEIVGQSQAVLEAQQKALEKARYKDECLDGIAYATAKQLLHQMTQDTINWINTGFKGSPTYLRDPGTFYKSLQDQAVYDFVAELNDPVKYPFGAEIGQSLGATYECRKHTSIPGNCFETTAVFTLGTEIGDNWEDFYTDFNTGGWGGWLAATQNPYNNPIDFQFAASQEIEARINAQQNEMQEEIQTNGGFLSLRRCAEYKDGDTAADADGGVDTFENSFNYEYSYFGEIDNCARYEVTTPGSAIADQLNISLGSDRRQLELADEMNESLGAIFDATLNTLVNMGLTGLTTALADTNQSAGFGFNYAVEDFDATWYVDPFAETDLHMLLRCTSQLTGIEKLRCRSQIELTEDYLDDLYFARDNIAGVTIPALIDLDMAMPEPDLGFKDRMLIQKTEEIKQINAKDNVDDILKFVGNLYATLGPIALSILVAAEVIVPPVSTIVGAVVAGVSAIILYVAANSEENIAKSKADAIQIVNAHYENELKRIDYDIAFHNLPSAGIARLQRDKLPAYRELLADYQETIVEQERVLQTLKDIEENLAPNLAPTAAETDGTDGYGDIASLRAAYSAISNSITTQDQIDETQEAFGVFEFDLDQIYAMTDIINQEMLIVPFGGHESPIPNNLKYYYDKSEDIADFAKMVSTYYDGADPFANGGSISDFYGIVGFNYVLLHEEEFVMPGRWTEEDVPAYVRLYSAFLNNDFTKTSSLQNPYSIYYPFPNPPFNPFNYGAAHRQPTKGDPICLSGGICWEDDATGYQYTNHPRLWYHRLNIQTFNSFESGTVPSDNYAMFMYINKYRDSYRNPTYPY